MSKFLKCVHVSMFRILMKNKRQKRTKGKKEIVIWLRVCFANLREYNLRINVFSFVMWCPLRIPRNKDIRFVWTTISLIGGFMFYLCYVYLFTYTGVQHNFHIRWCSCRSFNKNNTIGAGFAFPSGSPSCFSGVRVIRCLVYCVVLSRSLFVLLFLFLWPLCCRSVFYLRIIHLVPSNLSYQLHDGRHIWNCVVRVDRSLVLYVLLCRPLFVCPLCFFVWSLFVLYFFDLRLLATPLVFSNFSWISTSKYILNHCCNVISSIYLRLARGGSSRYNQRRFPWSFGLSIEFFSECLEMGEEYI